jgi:hypothetical protein
MNRGGWTKVDTVMKYLEHSNKLKDSNYI